MHKFNEGELTMELSEMTLTDVLKRMAELDEEVRSATDVKSVEKATEEKRQLVERKAELEDLEQRKSDALKLQDDKTGAKLIEGRKGEIKMEERTFTVESKEYRSAFLKQIRGIELDEVEQRAFTSASNSAGAVIPTETANEIIKKMKQYAPLLDEITLLSVAGNVTFAVENVVANAGLHSENGDITASTDTLTSVTLGSYEVCKLVSVSKTVATMSIDAFEGWLTDMLAERVSAVISRYILSGTGSSQPAGVGSIAWTENTNQVTVGKGASLTNANVQALIGLLGGGYDKNAKFVMSKKTLFTDFMPLQDNSKHAIVTVQGNNYFVYGYPVMLDEDVPVHEAYLGDFKKVVGNLSEAVNITSQFDINSNSYKYLGCAMFDSKIADANAFVHLAKATE
jgi:HK97 family phage major capsid protein